MPHPAVSVKSRDLLIEKPKHQLAGMQRHRFGASSEALDQLTLMLEDEEIAAAAERPGRRTQPGPSKVRRSAGRCRIISPATNRF